MARVLKQMTDIPIAYLQQDSKGRYFECPACGHKKYDGQVDEIGPITRKEKGQLSTPVMSMSIFVLANMSCRRDTGELF